MQECNAHQSNLLRLLETTGKVKRIMASHKKDAYRTHIYKRSLNCGKVIQRCGAMNLSIM